jgi:hypothetical protein
MRGDDIWQNRKEYLVKVYSVFPYDDLLDWDNGYGGKACKSFTDKPLERKARRTSQKMIDGQQILSEEWLGVK